jgi:hypothetical protein
MQALSGEMKCVDCDSKSVDHVQKPGGFRAVEIFVVVVRGIGRKICDLTAVQSRAEWPIAKFSRLGDHGRVTIAPVISTATQMQIRESMYPGAIAPKSTRPSRSGDLAQIPKGHTNSELR